MSVRLPYWSVAPDAVKAMRDVGAYLMKSGLEPALIDLVYLRISQINGCAYCCDLHSADLRKAGEGDQRLDCLAAWRDAPFYSERERAALAWAEAVTRVVETGAPDDVYAAVRERFSDKELADLTFVIAHMNAWNRVSIAFRHGPKARAK